MSLFDGIRARMGWGASAGSGALVEARILDVPSASNYRDLGGYETPDGPTAYRRFVRAGSTESLTRADLARLEAYGVCRVLDLRSEFEAPRSSDRFARRKAVTWENVPLFDYDLSDPRLTGVETPPGNYLIDGYVTMLSNHDAIRRIFAFLAGTPDGGCALFHCAAGMDRTGICALLLLGLAGVPRAQIVADYLYSFADMAEVDHMVFEGRRPRVREGSWNPLPSRHEAVTFVLDRIEGGYGSVPAYLTACGVSDQDLARVRDALLGRR